ncbi:MAG: hypothetical protein AAGF72_02115 [Pseudomonadota bacterium]
MDDYSALAGFRFPGGDYRIQPHRHWLACDAIGADPRAFTDVAHPLFVYYAAVGGMGMSLESLFDLCGAGPDTPQPMLGETSLEIDTPLRVGETYRVSGTIEEVRRRSGQRIGSMDLITAVFVLQQADGKAQARCRIVFVFPRQMS